jgi:hypothetical protein
MSSQSNQMSSQSNQADLLTNDLDNLSIDTSNSDDAMEWALRGESSDICLCNGCLRGRGWLGSSRMSQSSWNFDASDSDDCRASSLSSGDRIYLENQQFEDQIRAGETDDFGYKLPKVSSDFCNKNNHKDSTQRKKHKQPKQPNKPYKPYTSKENRRINYKYKIRISKNMRKRKNTDKYLSVDSPVKSLGYDNIETRSTHGNKLSGMYARGNKSFKSSKSDIVSNHKAEKKYKKISSNVLKNVKYNDIRAEENKIEEDVFQEKTDDALNMFCHVIDSMKEDVLSGAIMKVGSIDTIFEQSNDAQSIDKDYLPNNQIVFKNKNKFANGKKRIYEYQSPKRYITRNNSIDDYDTINENDLTVELNLTAESNSTNNTDIVVASPSQSSKYEITSVKFEDSTEYAEYDMLDDADLSNIMNMVNAVN